MTENRVKKIEYFTYGTGGFGKGMVGSFVATFALIYFTDAVAIAPAIAGALIFVAKIIVMFLLPLAGIKMDASRSSKGRFRPFLFALSFVMAIVTAFCFVSPELYGVKSVAGKTVLCFVSYLIWEASFNLHDVPFWSLASVISDKETERSVFLSVANVVTTMAGVVPILSVPYLTESFGNALGYLYAGLIFGLCGGALASVAYFKTRERITVTERKVSVKESFGILFSTKPLLIFDIGLLLSATVFSLSEAGTYVGGYLYAIRDGKIVYPDGSLSFLDEGLFLTLVMMLSGGGSALSEAVFPLFFKKLGMKKTYFVTAVFCAALCVGAYFFGYDKVGKASIYLLLVYCLALGFFGGMFESMKANLIPECADYTEWKTGVRCDGTLFSVQVMVSQIIESIPVLAVAFILQACGYREPHLEEVVTQTRVVRDGIYLAITLLPAAGVLLGIIPVCFYGYTGKFREKVLAELAEKRKEER